MNPYRNEPFGFRGPRGSYYGRGNVKFAILELLKEKPRHGYDIIREMEERSGGVYSPSPGVIYPTLQALEDQDYVKSVEQDGKKIYSITESGIPYLQGHQERQGHAHGHGRHGEGFRPPFAPPFPFGPGRRGAGPEAGSEEAAAPGSDAAAGAAEGGGPGEGADACRGPRGRGREPTVRAARPGVPGSPRAAARSSCARCAGCSATSPAPSSGRSATRRSSRRSAKCSAKPRPRSTTS